MKVKYLLVLAFMVAFAGLASTSFAAPFAALQYNVPLTATSVPVANDFSEDAFSDIAPGFWAWAEILEASGTATASTDAIVHGYGDGSFQPGFEVTRAMMAVFVANGKGFTDEVGEASFPDVPESYWAFTQIEQCVANGVVKGYDDGLFRPAASVARDQMAVFLVNATGVATEANTGQFDDVPDGFWAEAEIMGCANANIALGYPNGAGGFDYKPSKVVTRDQMAVFIWRALVRLDGNCVVLGGPAITDDAAFAPAGPDEAALFLPDELGGATGANTTQIVDEEEVDLEAAPDAVVFIVLDAAQVIDGDISFRVFHLDADENEVEDGAAAVTVDAAAAKAAVDATDGIPWMLASYQIPGTLAAGDYTLTIELPNGALLTAAEFTVE